jgi:two-component system, NtrC family, response regulator HydG
MVNGMNDKFYRAILETVHEGLLMVDTSGTILAVNPAFETMTGYSSRELVGKPCTELNCTGCEIIGKGPGEQWCALFAKGGVRGRKCEIAARDGHTVYVVKHATLLRDKSGRVTGAVETLSDISELVRQEEQIHSLRRSLTRQTEAFGILGSSLPILRLLDLIENVARSDAPVLIHGESGVGKELVARAIHEAGGRAEGNFIKVNCASLNENLLESELFGHVKGAFTGAGRSRIGRFEAASGGSIFLDEIGDISPALQVKLLRVLEAREIERVGDHRPIPIDVRVITATNRNLDELVSSGLFRQDLFYRINVVPVFVPPLRDHKEDIPLLARSFIEDIAGRSGKPISGLTPEALEIMLAYDWSGNVRELRNTIEYAFVLCHATLIGPTHLPSRIAGRTVDDRSCAGRLMPDATNPGNVSPARGERAKLLQALVETHGNQAQAARILGVSRVTVWKRMKKHGIELARKIGDSPPPDGGAQGDGK